MAVRESTQAEDYAPEPAVQRDRGRSEDQQDVDKRTEALVTQWDEAGQPGMVDGSYAGPVVRFDVDDKAEGKRMVGRAFTQINKARKTHTDEAGKLAPSVPTGTRIPSLRTAGLRSSSALSPYRTRLTVRLLPVRVRRTRPAARRARRTRARRTRARRTRARRTRPRRASRDAGDGSAGSREVARERPVPCERVPAAPHV
jgi:hypothetical protein